MRVVRLEVGVKVDAAVGRILEPMKARAVVTVIVVEGDLHAIASGVKLARVQSNAVAVESLLRLQALTVEAQRADSAFLEVEHERLGQLLRFGLELEVDDRASFVIVVDSRRGRTTECR